MGGLAAPVGNLFGIGPSHGDYYSPETGRATRYYEFADKPDKATEGVAGSRIAAEEIQKNPLLASLYGEGGLQSRLGTEEQNLASRGFSLQPQDYEAYGQTAGDISRLFGQQEQDASKALARRGLGAAGSGAAGATFSGLAGNKNEMLAKAQTDIAQKRMADTQQRLQATRNMMGSLGAQAGQQIGAQFERQLAGRNQRGEELARAANIEKAMNQENSASVDSKTGAKNQTLGDAWAQGTFSGTRSGTADATSSWAKMGSNPFGGGGGGGGGGGMFSMFSDERLKENVRDGSSDVRGFLDSIHPHSYEYKDEVKGSLFGGSGEHTSPMAQELEQTELGSQMVEETPEGKMVDYGKGFGTLLAAQADLNARLKRLEGGQ